MQRYFIKNDQMNEAQFTIRGEDVKHITKVMRMTKGDQILCINEKGQVVLCEIQYLSVEEVKGSVIKYMEENTELPVKVTVAQALPKGDKMELIVQKGTELGAFAFLPFQASRSIVKWDEKKAEKKLERLQKIAKEAAEQSYRNIIPTIESFHSFQELLQSSCHFDVKIVAYEELAKQGEMKNLVVALNSIKENSSILLVIGPEGGLSETEITQLKEHDFHVCSFGPRILRTETAALYFLAAVSYQFEMLR